jgi:hypothetical protein
LGVLVLLGAAGTALATAVSPPPGTPNLALMVIQPSDLPSGADCQGFGDVGYVTPQTGFSAAYQGDCRTRKTVDGVHGIRLEDYVAIAPGTTSTGNYVAGVAEELGTRQGRDDLILQDITNAPASEHLKPKDFKFTGAGSADIGSSSFVETLTITTTSKHRKRENQAVIVAFADGATVGTVDLTGASEGEPVPQSGAIALAKVIDTHIDTVLASPSSG